MGYILFPKQSHPESIHWRGEQPQSGQWIYVIGCVAYIDQFRDLSRVMGAGNEQ